MKSEAKLISIIIPVFNGGKTIKKAIDSLAFQSEKNIEILVINDASTDNTLSVLESFEYVDVNLKIFHNDINIGVSASRNIGIKKARGHWLMFLDADDYVSANYIEAVIAVAEDYDLVVTSFIQRNHSSQKIAKNHGLQGDNQFDSEDLFNYLEDYFFCPYKFTLIMHCWNKLFERNRIIKENIFFDEELSQLEDLHFVSRYLLSCDRIIVLDTPGYTNVISQSKNNLSYMSGGANKGEISSFIKALHVTNDLKKFLEHKLHLKSSISYDHFVTSMVIIFCVRTKRRFWHRPKLAEIINLHRWLSSEELRKFFKNFNLVEGESILIYYCISRLPAIMATIAILFSRR